MLAVYPPLYCYCYMVRHGRPSEVAFLPLMLSHDILGIMIPYHIPEIFKKSRELRPVFPVHRFAVALCAHIKNFTVAVGPAPWLPRLHKCLTLDVGPAGGLPRLHSCLVLASPTLFGGTYEAHVMPNDVQSTIHILLYVCRTNATG